MHDCWYFTGKCYHYVDFGCEGLPEGQQPVDDVLLQDESGNQITIQIPDAQLYASNLNEGDEYWME